MIKEITKDFLRNNNACSRGVAWWEKEQNHEIFTTLNRLIETNNLNWANWLIVHVMDRTQKIKYAVFAAQQVLDIYEKKYPDDARPRKAIEAAIKCIENDTGKNRKAAADAADVAAAAATDAADAADVAAYYAAYAADVAAYYAAYAAAAAADVAADIAAAAAAAAEPHVTCPGVNGIIICTARNDAAYVLRIKILNYGIELLKGEIKCL